MDNEEKRKQRGWVDKTALDAYNGATIEEMLSLLTATDPQKRTIAAHLLPLSCETANILLDAFSHESALYTRLALAEKLEKGDGKIAEKMLPYLASIGNNQHRVPVQPSHKKSFPLPRDLIARSLGRMDPTIFPVLMDSLATLSVTKLREVIDAIGYLAFYNPAVATDAHYDRLLQLRKTYKEDTLIQWKLIICFSAFPQSRSLLLEESVFAAEAQRSLKLLTKKESSSR